VKINPAIGCTGRDKRRERDMQAKSVDRTVCFHIIYQETQLCGRSPRERVKHVYIVVMCD
jgi:hypothetical protein